MTRYAPRHRPKRDLSEPGVVDALEAAGCTVWRKLPVDLLVRVPGSPPGTFHCIEAKTPKGKKGALRLDKRQEDQAKFVEATGTPYVTSPEQAIAWVGRVRR